MRDALHRMSVISVFTNDTVARITYRYRHQRLLTGSARACQRGLLSAQVRRSRPTPTMSFATRHSRWLTSASAPHSTRPTRTLTANGNRVPVGETLSRCLIALRLASQRCITAPTMHH